MLLIPTYSRPTLQITWGNLSPSLRERTKLVVQKRECHLYPSVYPLIILPDNIRTLAATRQWLLENVEVDNLIMLDDDLMFAVRRADDPTKFASATPDEVDRLFAALDAELVNFSHVGIAGREGANRQTERRLFNTRVMRILAYNRRTLLREKIRFDRLEFMLDFDVTLELLRRRYPNIIINDFVQDQKGSNTSGGCSTYRTMEAQAADAEKLAELHPEFVTVVTKQTKTAWGGQERKDVRVQWKRAFNSGSTGVLDRGEGTDTEEEGG